MAAAGRAAAWLLPAGRRDWVEAVWAEAHEVPPGLERLAWRAGGVWMLAREALMPRRLGRAALFAVAAAVAAWAAWPDSSVLSCRRGPVRGDRHRAAAGRAAAAGPPVLRTGRRRPGRPVPARRRVRGDPGPDTGQGRRRAVPAYRAAAGS